MQVTTINSEEFGIEPKQANEIIGTLPQILNERSILETQFNEILTLDIEDFETPKKARELRLLIQKNRTQGINTWHKTTKDYFLKGGQFVDAIKRKEIAVNERMESDLEQIEKHSEIKEQKRLDELEAKRIEASKDLAEFMPFGINLKMLSDEDFEKLLSGARLQQQAKIEADKKAELERLEVIRKEEEERKKIFEENERLKAEAIERQKKIDAENKRIEEERAKERAEKEKIERELIAEKQRIADMEAKRIAEEKAKQEAERIEAERLKAEEIAKQQAPDIEKLTNWINSFRIEDLVLNDEQMKNKADQIKQKFESFKSWAIKQI